MTVKLIDLESRSRRNNLIFRGLHIPTQIKDYRQVVSVFCADKFGTNSRPWVNRAHPLGRERSAIIAHFPSDSDIEHIMERVKHLKGTEYTVHRDFSREVRHKRACLGAVQAEVVKVAGVRRLPLVFNHLTIDNTRFTWDIDSGKLIAGGGDGAVKLKQMFQHDFLCKLKEDELRQPRQGTHVETLNAVGTGIGNMDAELR